MKTNFLGIALLAIMVCTSCDKDNDLVGKPAETEIACIGYHVYGGRASSEQLLITPDSIHYYFYSALYYDRKIEQHIVTPKALWEDLLSKCDLSLFKQIKSGKASAPVDGIDTDYIVKTKSEEISITNGYGDEYEQMHAFFESIGKILDDNRTADLLIGNWINRVEANGYTRYERTNALKDNIYGFSFQYDGSFIERKNAGWCATPPVYCEDYSGLWTKTDSIVDITVGFWGGTSNYQWKVISVDEKYLTIDVLKNESTYAE